MIRGAVRCRENEGEQSCHLITAKKRGGFRQQLDTQLFVACDVDFVSLGFYGSHDFFGANLRIHPAGGQSTGAGGSI